MSENKDDKGLEVVKSNLYVFLGCLPMIVLSSICVYLLYGDYERNNYSLMSKSRFYSNSNPNDLFEKSAQIGEFSCARYFTDYVITEDEANVLLKFSQVGFNKIEQNEKVDLNGFKNDEEFKNIYK